MNGMIVNIVMDWSMDWIIARFPTFSSSKSEVKQRCRDWEVFTLWIHRVLSTLCFMDQP